MEIVEALECGAHDICDLPKTSKVSTCFEVLNYETNFTDVFSDYTEKQGNLFS